jgi:hypothetical protein
VLVQVQEQEQGLLLPLVFPPPGQVRIRRLQRPRALALALVRAQGPALVQLQQQVLVLARAEAAQLQALQPLEQVQELWPMMASIPWHPRSMSTYSSALRDLMTSLTAVNGKQTPLTRSNPMKTAKWLPHHSCGDHDFWAILA